MKKYNTIHVDVDTIWYEIDPVIEHLLLHVFSRLNIYS